MAFFDIFKARHKHSKPSVRLEEVKAMNWPEHKIALLERALDSNFKVRNEAISKIPEIQELINITTESSSKELSNKLQKLVKKELINNAESSVDWVKHLKEGHEDVFKKTSNPQIQLKLLDLIEKENVLTQCIAETNSDELAKAIITKIEKTENLEIIKQKTCLKWLKEQISKKLDFQIEEERKIQNEKLSKIKIEVLQSSIKNLEESSTIETQLQEIQLLRNEAKSISADSELLDSLELLEQKANQKVEAKLQADLKKTTNKLSEKAKALLSDLSSLIQKGNKSIEQVNKLKNKWNNLNDEYLNSDIENNSNVEWNNLLSVWSNLSEKTIKPLSETNSFDAILGQLEKIEGAPNKQNLNEIILKKADHLELTEEQEMQFDILVKSTEGKLKNEELKLEAETVSLKDFNQKLTLLKSFNEDSDFDLVSKGLRESYHSWKELTNETKKQNQDLWNEFKDIASPLEEMTKWREWHSEQEKEKILAELVQLESQKLSEEELFKKVRSLQDKWKNAGSISHTKHQELWPKFKELSDQLMAKCQIIIQKWHKEKIEHLEHKKEIVDKLKELLKKNTSDGEFYQEVRELQQNWKKTGAVPKEDAAELWETYREISNTHYGRRKIWLLEQQGLRKENLEKKRVLIAKAKELSESDNWSKTAEGLKDLQTEWKKIGYVPKEDAQVIWQEFRFHIDAFFNKRRDYYNEKEGQRVENLKLKTCLCEEVETLAQSESIDFNNLINQIEEIKAKWQSIGTVPREASTNIWERFCAATDSVDQKRAEFDPNFANELCENAEKKQDIIQLAKKSATKENWKEATSELVQQQADWKKIGRAGETDGQLWKEFREICDDFFTRKKDHYEILEQNRINNLDDKKEILEEAKQLSFEDSTPETQRMMKQLRYRWREIGPVPRKYANTIWDEFNEFSNKILGEVEPKKEIKS